MSYTHSRACRRPRTPLTRSIASRLSTVVSSLALVVFTLMLPFPVSSMSHRSSSVSLAVIARFSAFPLCLYCLLLSCCSLVVCVSADSDIPSFLAPFAALIASGASTFDVGIDRLGWDFAPGTYYPLPANSTAADCASACQANKPCKAWWYSACDTGTQPVCSLKYGVSGQSVVQDCVTSGFIPARLAAVCGAPSYRRWYNTTVPAGFPLPRSTDLLSITYAEECAITYGQADTWFCSWDVDDVYYCLFQDGTVNGVTVAGYSDTFNSRVSSGTSRVYGSSPFNLTVVVNGVVYSNTSNHRYRYPSANIHQAGVWYVSTSLRNDHNDYILPGNDCGGNCVEGPVVSWKVSEDDGQTWTDPRYAVMNGTDNVFRQDSSANLSNKVKFGEPHFVDLGRGNEYSPDGKVYLISHGSNSSFPGTTQGGWEQWDEGDQLYLARVKLSPQTVNDVTAWEFWSGHGLGWVSGAEDGLELAQPLFTWPGKTGSTFMTWVPALGKFLTVISTPSVPPAHTSQDNDDVYVLESEEMTGPFYLVDYFNAFGPHAYFPDFPSRFLSPTVDAANSEFGAFLGYSEPNYSWDPQYVAVPKFSTYAWSLLSVKFRLGEGMTDRIKREQQRKQQPSRKPSREDDSIRRSSDGCEATLRGQVEEDNCSMA